MIKIQDTLSGLKKPLKPRQDKKINMFVCGPTVYDYSHIGHARTYLIFDAIVKYLKSKRYQVTYLQNITDLDDKIILRAREKETTPKELAKTFEKEYLEDMASIGIDSVSKYARATDYIPQIIKQVQQLSEKEYAYVIPEDGIYYDISKFETYGKLSRRTMSQAEDAVSRIDETKGKRNKGDFCLWKFSKEGEPSWDSVWGKGRPGWHIEDTAITQDNFGPQYDIHGGGRDLTFPHHEAEIAQMEAASGKSPLVNYWMHTGFLTIKGQKMSKSLGNFVTIKDFIKENSPRLLRLIMIKGHYRSPLDYNEKVISQGKRELEKLDDFIDKLKEIKTEGKETKISEKAEKEFQTAMEDDFNTPRAVASIFELMNEANELISKNKLSKKDSESILSFLEETDKVFGFIFSKEKIDIPKAIEVLAKEREKSRKEKDFKKADEIREKIKKGGYLVEDTNSGIKIKKLK
jgi:cysteinyl-tRNA synthetase